MIKLRQTFIFLLLVQTSCASAQLVTPAQGISQTPEACDGLYEEVAYDWKKQEPRYPGVLRLGRAYMVYKQALKTYSQTKNDKMLHCLMGCEISRNVDVETSTYTAWLKEKNDLEDCNPKTKFDLKDFQATIFGAENSSTEQQCPLVCNKLPESLLKKVRKIKNPQSHLNE